MYKKLPPLILERLSLGELSEQERERLNREFGTDFLNAEVERLRQENASTLSSYPIRSMASEIRSKQTRERDVSVPLGVKAKWMGVGLAVACAALALFYIQPPVQTEDHIILKGGDPRLTIYRKAKDGAERLAANAMVHDGDLLQVRYVASGAKFGVIYSIDGNGAITRHDKQGATPTSLKSGGEIDLGHSYELDDAPEFEIFVFMTGEQSVPTSELLNSIKNVKFSPTQLPVLSLPKNWRASFYVLLKGAAK
jgi:hypothetical protein